MTTDLHELAALYALGMIEEPERPLFEDHLRGCAQCQEELRDFKAVADEIGMLAAADPPPRLRGRLMDELGRASKAPGVVLKEHGIYLAMADAIAWRSVIPGVYGKALYSD